MKALTCKFIKCNIFIATQAESAEYVRLEFTFSSGRDLGTSC